MKTAVQHGFIPPAEFQCQDILKGTEKEVLRIKIDERTSDPFVHIDNCIAKWEDEELPRQLWVNQTIFSIPCNLFLRRGICMRKPGGRPETGRRRTIFFIFLICW